MPISQLGMLAADKGLELAQQGAAAGMGLLLSGWNDQRQLHQQGKLQNLQIQGNKEMMDYSYQKQLQMWKDTNYAAQKQQMKEAGLNPALMYGMSGGGGQTVGSPTGSVQGANAPTGGREVQDMLGMGLQMQLLQSQKNLLDSQTNKNNVEANKTAGVDTKEALQRIDLMAQQEDNAKWDWELKQIDWAMKQTDRYIKQNTVEEAITKFRAETGKAIAEMQNTMIEAGINEETRQTKIEQVKANLFLTEADIALRKSGIAINDAQIDKLRNDIGVALRMATVAEKQQAVTEAMTNWSKQFPSIGQATGRILNDGIESIFKLSTIPRAKHY